MHSSIIIDEGVFLIFVYKITNNYRKDLNDDERYCLNKYICWSKTPQGHQFWKNIYLNSLYNIDNTLLEALHSLCNLKYKKIVKVTGMCHFLTERGL